jgi:hypothetical protein
MSFNRRLGGGTQWAIATAATGIGVLATLIVTNTINHAGWNPWPVVLTWIGITAWPLCSSSSAAARLGPGAPGTHWAGTGAGDGISGGAVAAGETLVSNVVTASAAVA